MFKTINQNGSKVWIWSFPSPKSIILQRRIEEATYLLRYTSNDMSTIAYLLISGSQPILIIFLKKCLALLL